MTLIKRLERVTEIIASRCSPYVKIDGIELEFWFDTQVLTTHDIIDLESHGAVVKASGVSFTVSH